MRSIRGRARTLAHDAQFWLTGKKSAEGAAMAAYAISDADNADPKCDAKILASLVTLRAELGKRRNSDACDALCARASRLIAQYMGASGIDSAVHIRAYDLKVGMCLDVGGSGYPYWIAGIEKGRQNGIDVLFLTFTDHSGVTLQAHWFATRHECYEL